jgi:hypothetical protein
MKGTLVAIGLSVFSMYVLAQDSQTTEAGKQQEQRSCVPCHSLRLVESQRLSQAAWEKEVNKMIGWGAEVSNRQALLDYLSRQYGTSKPAAPRELTANGTTTKAEPTPSSK